MCNSLLKIFVEQIHKTLWKEYEISGADRMFVERASKILEPYEGESEDEK